MKTIYNVVENWQDFDRRCDTYSVTQKVISYHETVEGAIKKVV